MKRRYLSVAVGCLLAAVGAHAAVPTITVTPEQRQFLLDRGLTEADIGRITSLKLVKNAAGVVEAYYVRFDHNPTPDSNLLSAWSPAPNITVPASATGINSTAVGGGSVASAPVSSAFGAGASATAEAATASGALSNASGFLSSAYGFASSATADSSTAIGAYSLASGNESTSIGHFSTASGDYSNSIGNFSTASGDYSLAIGNFSTASGSGSMAIGHGSTASGDYSNSIGFGSKASGSDSTSIGRSSTASGSDSISIGYWSTASGDYSLAIGNFSTAKGYYCVALGEYSSCTEPLTASFGSTSFTRRLVNVSAGQANTDAATVGQLRGAAYAIGGGSYIDASGNYIAPTLYLSSGYTYTDLTSAIYDLDGRLWNLENATTTIEPSEPEPSAPVQQSTAVVAGSNIQTSTDDQGNTTVSLADQVQLSDQGSVQVGGTTVNGEGLTIQGGPSVTTQGVDAGNRRVTSVADGRIEQGSTDAVNGGQLYQVQQDWDDRWAATNARIDHLGDRMNALGAKSAAMAQMAAASTPLAVGEAALTAGAGFSSNRSALAVGYRVRMSERTSFSAGFAIGGGSSVMGGVGVQINLGR